MILVFTLNYILIIFRDYPQENPRESPLQY